MLEEVLLERYPQLLFLLRTIGLKTIPKGLGTLSDLSFPSDQVDLILCVGLPHPQELLILEPWLKLSPRKEIMLFEEDVETIRLFCEMSDAIRVLANKQIHLKYILQSGQMEKALQEAVQEYPAERVNIHVLNSYQEIYCPKKLSLATLRKATITSALFNEEVYYHLLFRNLLPNFLRLPSCLYVDKLKGKFQGIPAIICGAGPSLAQDIPLLKELQTKALIIAGGSTLAALSSQGVIPHIGFALDPNPEEYDRLKANQAMQVPMLFGSRVAPSIFRTCHGPLGYMRTFSGGFAEQALEEELQLIEESLFHGVSQEGISVTVMCFAAAVRFGCDPIMLSGIDLAYTGGKRYAEGVMSDSSVELGELSKEQKTSEQLLLKKNRHGKEVYTMIKWVMEAAAIEDFASLYPNTKVIDCMKEGLGFPRFPYLSLQEAANNYLHLEQDLYGRVYQALQEMPTFEQEGETIGLFLKELQESISRSEVYAQKALTFLESFNSELNPAEDTWLTLCTMDFTEEKAFELLLEPMQELITQEILRGLRVESFEGTYGMELALLKKTWMHNFKLVQHYGKVFGEYTQEILALALPHHDRAGHCKI